MRKTLRLAAAISLAATLGLIIPASAQQHEQARRPQGHPGGPPGQHPPGPAGRPGPQAFRPQGPGPHGGPPGARGVHALGERGYSFRGPGGGRREIASFGPRERAIWLGGRWHHDMRFGRLGYWWEVNSAWYYYDRPFEGPPAFVSEVEFMDDDLGPPAVMAPAPAVVVAPPPAVVVAPPPVVVAPPPVVCVGPFCVR